MSPLVGFFKNERGAAATAYALIATGISLSVITTAQALGTDLNAAFTAVVHALKYH